MSQIHWITSEDADKSVQFPKVWVPKIRSLPTTVLDSTPIHPGRRIALKLKDLFTRTPLIKDEVDIPFNSVMNKTEKKK